MNSTPNPILDDPRLTAYALGELSQAEQAEVEALLANDPVARAHVQEIRDLAGQLRQDLASEAAPSLTDSQRQAVLSQSKARPARHVLTSRMWLGTGLAAAASLAIAFVMIDTAQHRGRETAGLVGGGGGGGGYGGGGANELKDKSPGKSERIAGKITDGSAEVLPDSQLGITLEQGLLGEKMHFGIDGIDGAVKAERDRSMIVEGELRARQMMASFELATGATPADVTLGKPAASPTAPLSPPPPPPMTASAATAREDMGGMIPGRRAPPRQPYVPTTGSTKAADEAFRRRVAEQRDLRFIYNDDRAPGTENYKSIVENEFLDSLSNPLSTFSIDVDTASYANVRRFLNQGQLPPPDAVRIEELINYFRYDDEGPQASSREPFAARMEIQPCPWNPRNQLVRVSLKGREIPMAQRPATNLVFLIDVSGSMQDANKLPLVRESLKLLVDQLNGDDKLAIVTYAGVSGVLMDSTYCNDRAAIKALIDQLGAGGSTNGAGGIISAYDVAQHHFIQGGVNRVILATDGDFNVGVSDEGGLLRLIEEKRAGGVFLSVLGFGEGNLQDAKMELLADKGNGQYAYIDSLREGRKVLVEQAAGTLITIAKDVKIQVEFNPAKVASYRLIGYENRVMAKEDFNDDRKDAGEIGAGHAVTALYEIVPVDAAPSREQQIEELKKQIESIENILTTAKLSQEALAELQATLTDAKAKFAALERGSPAPGSVDPLKYQRPTEIAPDADERGEILTIKLRYKLPEGDESTLVEHVLREDAVHEAPSSDFEFAASVAAFGMILRNSEHRSSATLSLVQELAILGLESDEEGYRAEFMELVRKARALRGE